MWNKDQPKTFGRYIFDAPTNEQSFGVMTGWYLPKYGIWLNDCKQRFKTDEVYAWMDIPERSLLPYETIEDRARMNEIMANMRPEIDVEFALFAGVTFD